MKMKPVKYKPYSKTSYLPSPMVYDHTTAAQDLLHHISLQEKEIERLNLVVDHKEKELAAYQREVERLQGIVNGQTEARFGRSTEKRNMPADAEFPGSQATSRKLLRKHLPRGAKPGHKGFGRVVPDLPEKVFVHPIPCDQQTCPECGQFLKDTGFTEESHQVDVEIRYVRVKHVRKRAVRSCTCSGPKFVTAPKPLQVIPKSMFSHGFLAHVITMKYFFQIPLYRQTLIMGMHSLPVNESTLSGIFHKLHDLFSPLYDQLVAHSRTAKHWHADETGWKNFILSEEKQSFNWWLWVFASNQTVVYVLDSTRSASVPLKHLGEDAEGILSSDRYSAYNKLTHETEGLRNSFCWAHVRRDFIDAGKAFTFLVDWADRWVNMIGELYLCNRERLATGEDGSAFAIADAALRSAVERFKEQLHKEQETAELHSRQRKILRSALRNWEALTVFLDHPEVPMDNNAAERLLRPAAVGRKNYYGSHATWSGEFAAICMSLFQTARLHGLCPEAYMRYILDELANNADPSSTASSLLPWEISESVLQDYSMRRAVTKRESSRQAAGG
jgi:transposase